MSLDLYEDEAVNRLSNLQPVQVPEASAFDGFFRGTGMAAMRGFAKTARAIDMAGAIGPIAQDAFTGGTEAQERYFKEHDDVFNRAVDYWTPKPNEVGMAGEVVGGLLSMLPTVALSPALAVGATTLDVSEDLTRQGVDPGKAVAVGATQAAGLGLGIWLPILGQNGWQRIVLGGAGFNAAQGVATRAASAAILEGTPAEDQFKAFDPTAMTLDVLLGAAFGTLAHLSPAQRAQGAEAWAKIKDWAQNLRPADVDAIAALREAQHLNVDSAPGKLEMPEAIDAHVTDMRTAIDQVLRGEPVSVDGLASGMAKPDDVRNTESFSIATKIREMADQVRTELGLPHPDDLNPAIETQRPAQQDVPPIRTEAQPGKVEPPPPPGETQPAGTSAAPDILAQEAQRMVAAQPDTQITIGRNPDGTPITTTAKQFLDDTMAEIAEAKNQARLFEVAAGCYMGRM